MKTLQKVTEKTLYYIVQQAPDNIAQERSCSMLF